MALNKKHYILLSIFFFILGIANVSASLLGEYYFGILWFCSLTVWLFTLGLYLRNNFLLSTILTASFFLELLWTIDVISYLTLGRLTIGIAEYLFTISPARFIITFYHLFLFIVPMLVVFDQKKFHKFSWAGASAFLLIVSIITLLLTKANINCVRSTCELGLFDFFNKAIANLSSVIPLFIVHWFLVTIIVFIPTHYLFKYLIEWISK